jgi:putative aminopeptidase FrvX
MDQHTVRMLEELTSVPGVPGFETEVRKAIRKYLPKGVGVSTDALGSILCEKRGASDHPRIMIPGHMDEIGFMVKVITKDGFIKFHPLGGWWDQVLLSQRVDVYGKKGPVPGIVGSKPPHLLPANQRSRVMTQNKMYIDVGAKDRKEAERFGIRPGDPIVPQSVFTHMANPKLMLAKAWDDRVGVGLFLSVLRRLSRMSHPNTVIGVGTTQEEVGTRGATTAVHVASPDVCLVADVGLAGDTPGIEEDETQGRLGGGVQICLHDSGMIPHRGLRDFVLDIAKRNQIKTQLYSLSGGTTDGRPIHVHKAGVPSIYIGVPTRYIHSHGGIIHADDYDAAVKLMIAVCRTLDAGALKKIMLSSS